MATPAYAGQGQPSADGGSGWLGRLGAYFGSASTPPYATAPVAPPSKPSGDESGAATVMRPSSIGSIDPDALASGQIAIIVPRTTDDSVPIDPDALASGQVAIVVRRGALVQP